MLSTERRARALLESCLTEAQRTDMAQLGYFQVTGSRNGRYRIHTRTGACYNVIRYYEKAQPQTYCAMVPDYLPTWDQFLAQKLMIETNERAFLRIANRSR